MTQAEVMRQVTEERDLLHERLSHYKQPLARSNTAGAGSGGWIAAAYGTDSRPAQPLSGEQAASSEVLSHLHHAYLSHLCSPLSVLGWSVKASS